MSRAIKFFLVLVFLVSIVTTLPASAADEYCFCFDNVTNLTPGSDVEEMMKEGTFPWRDSCKVTPAIDCHDVKKIGNRTFEKCVKYTNQAMCDEAVLQWDLDVNAQYKGVVKAKTGIEAKEGESSFIPSCAFEDKLSPECKDVGIFVILLINITNYLFTIIGGLALLIFIYGGFVLILSQGRSEQVQKGKDAMTAAVIGLIVAFSGYLLVNFLGSVVGVYGDFILG